LLYSNCGFWDGPDVRQVVHLGAPDNIEGYMQETGRCGRDGKPCLALILLNNYMNQYCEKSMIEYQTNTTNCRRDVIWMNTHMLIWEANASVVIYSMYGVM